MELSRRIVVAASSHYRRGSCRGIASLHVSNVASHAVVAFQRRIELLAEGVQGARILYIGHALGHAVEPKELIKDFGIVL